MSKMYANTKEVLQAFIKEDSFKKEELYAAIKVKNGIMRVRPGYTVRAYLEDLEYEGKFKYIPKDKVFKKIK